jgi:hypothetical protein
MKDIKFAVWIWVLTIVLIGLVVSIQGMILINLAQGEKECTSLCGKSLVYEITDNYCLCATEIKSVKRK